MMEDSHEGGEQLFDTTQNEELAEKASTNNDELFESSEVEESKEKPAVSAEVRKKSVEAYQKKIDAGEVTIDDLPPAQKWMAKDLRPKTVVDIEKLTDEAVDRKLRERDSEAAFQAQKEALKDLDLSSKKQTALNEEYSELRAMGLSKDKALEKAMKIVGVEPPTRAGVIPRVGNYNPKPPRDENLSHEERVKKLEAARRGSGIQT